MVPSGDDIPVKDQPYVVNASPTALSPGYVADSELEEGLEEDPIDYAADADDDEEEEEESLEDNHDKEEDHLASADSTIVVSLAIDHVPSTEEREPVDILEADMPPRKRLLLTAPTPRFEVGESSAAVAGQPRSTVACRVDYSFMVSYQANVRRRQSEEFHTRHQDDQEDRATLRDEVDTLRRYLSFMYTTHEHDLVEARQDLD
nr:hypothetical protein [Tanacetum cinerariifolium]